MSTLYLLIPLAAILVIIAVGLFLWSIKSGQFEDMEGPGFRILMDDDEDLIPDDAKVKKSHSKKKKTDEDSG
jgi:cbb3-type cytochrome oxidase maturation protein